MLVAIFIAHGADPWQKKELAVAYLDLGDVATARDLLNEVAAGHDATARDEALQLLREIG